MALPKFGDKIDEMVQLLESIARDVGDTPDVDVHAGGTRPEHRFSTGPGGMLVDAAGVDETEELELGFTAKAVLIRTDGGEPVYVSFNDPSNNAGRWIPVRPRDFPLSFGGSHPIMADTIWFSWMDPEALEDEDGNELDDDEKPGVHVFAY